MVVLHETLPRASDELVELDNGALSRSITPYAKLSLESIQTAASNCKVTSRVSRKLNELMKGPEKIDEEEEMDVSKPLHQLGQIFQGSHLASGDMTTCFMNIYGEIRAQVDGIDRLVKFEDRMREGFLMLDGIGEVEKEKVDTWLMEDAKDATFEILSKLCKSSRVAIVALEEDDPVPYFTHQVIKIREMCRRHQGGDGENDMISFLKHLKKSHPEKKKLVSFTPKRGKDLNELMKEDD